MYRPAALVFGAGVVLRLVIMVVYRPTHWQWIDAVRFARIDPPGLFDDFWMPAGYPVFLKVTHGIWNEVFVTIGAQHALGVLSAWLLYDAVRHTGAPRWVGLVPAGIVLFGGDWLYLEHILMAETLYITAVAFTVWAAVRALASERPVLYCAIAGVGLAAAVLTRGGAGALFPVIAVWLVVVVKGGWRGRALALAAFGGVTIGLIGGYAALAHTGRYSGLADMSGWNLYARVAPFADCRRFSPPPGTAVLCESSDPETRPGPFFYAWQPDAPSYRNFALNPTSSQKLGGFARTALVAQPLDYMRAVAKDMVRYVDPSFGAKREWAGIESPLFSFENHTPGLEGQLAAEFTRDYAGTLPSNRGWDKVLAGYQRTFRLGGVVLLATLVLGCLSLALTAGIQRRVAILCLVVGVVLMAVPVMVLSWDIRYGVPGETLLPVPAVLGATGIVRRLRRREPGATQPQSVTPAA
jgi:hypothetical protein